MSDTATRNQRKDLQNPDNPDNPCENSAQKLDIQILFVFQFFKSPVNQLYDAPGDQKRQRSLKKNGNPGRFADSFPYGLQSLHCFHLL